MGKRQIGAKTLAGKTRSVGSLRVGVNHPLSVRPELVEGPYFLF
jgi:hypothetical protein